MTLKIVKLTSDDVRDFFCHAENPFGQSTRPVSVRVRNTAAANQNVSQCCIAQNVSAGCMDACSFYIDIDAVIDRTECIPDFDKLMKCAADGSDHRVCCANGGVSRKCLNWCRGEPITNGLCALQDTKTIVHCFQSNRDRLPGPPMNPHVQVISNEDVIVTWSPPQKNPHVVEGYRIFWHAADSNSDDLVNRINGIGSMRVDAKTNNVHLGGLEKDVIYELVIKAGNQHGKSKSFRRDNKRHKNLIIFNYSID